MNEHIVVFFFDNHEFLKLRYLLYLRYTLRLQFVLNFQQVLDMYILTCCCEKLEMIQINLLTSIVSTNHNHRIELFCDIVILSLVD